MAGPRRRLRREFLILAGLVLPPIAIAQSHSEALGPEYVAITPNGRRAYVTQRAAGQVAVVNLATGEREGTFAASGPPTGLALAADGATLYVTCAAPAGCVDVFRPDHPDPAARWPAGHTPQAPVLSADGRTLYLCDRFQHDVLSFATASGTQQACIRVAREPVAAALTPDGRRLLVAHHLPAGRADGAAVAASVSVMDTDAPRTFRQVQLPPGSTGVRGLCVAPDGRFAYVTHILARYTLPTTQLERGWMNTNALTILDVAAAAVVNTVLLDDVERGAANPWGVACTTDGAFLCVAHAGTNEISVIDRAALHARLAREHAAGTSGSASLSLDLAFLGPLRQRVALPGVGPRGVALAGRCLLVAEYFSDALAVVHLEAAGPRCAPEIRLGNGSLTEARRGELLFNDATLCFQHWQSCASCHPDGRADGLNWDLLNDGIGNAKNTRSLLRAHETPPAMSLGVRADASTAVRAGLRHILQATRPAADAAALDAYLRGMQPVPSPHLRNGGRTVVAEQGRRVFEAAGCANCHCEPQYTDGRRYDVGTGAAGEHFDTPTLVEVWRTAPYLHDGRAATLADALEQCNPDDRHGSVSHLNPQERAALVAYVLSL